MPGPRRTDAASALRTLQLAEARWQALLTAAPDAIIGIDTDGNITLFNRTAQQMFGYTEVDVVGRNVNMLVPSPYRDEHDRYLREYQTTGTPKAIGKIRQVEARRKSGEVFPIELSVSEARVDSDVIYTAIIRDVSERKRFEEDLLAREQQLATMISNLPGFVYRGRNHRDWPMEFVSSGVLDVLGVPSTDLTRGNRRFGDFIHPDDAETVWESVQQAIAAGRPFELTYRIRPLQGVERWVWERGRAVGDGYIEGIVSDISEQKAMAAELAQLEQEKRQNDRLAEFGAITAKIAHDLGNPLAGLAMQAELILRRAEDERIRKPAEGVVDTVRRLESLVHELMGIAREQRLQLSEIRLSDLITRAIDPWTLVAADKQIVLELAIPAELSTIRGDEDKLRRVFDNLLKNSIEAIEQGPGRVVVHVSLPASEKIRVSIADTGPGISEGTDVFCLFETTKLNGTGLGLAVARQIVTAHGGSIEHEPATPNGTIFHVDLPRTGPSVRAPIDRHR